MDVTIACPCPPRGTGEAPHDTDTVTLRERLDFRSATMIRKAIALDEAEPELKTASILATMTELYALFGIEAWTLVDEKGKPVPVSHTAIRQRILDNPAAFDQATVIADAADDLYQAAVLLPLLARASASSPTTPTEPSTSAPTGGSPTPLRRSRRSSTSTSPTDGIEATSPSLAGVSSSSQSSTSAA